jgi:hypothetical protein
MNSKYIKLFLSIILVCVLFCGYKVNVLAESGQVVINEIQTAGLVDGTADQEFIEIKNIGTTGVDLTGWKLKYIPSTGILSNSKIIVTFLNGTIIYPGGYIVVAPSAYLGDLADKIDYESSSFGGLAATGATVVLENGTGVSQDMVGWGSKPTIICEGSLAIAPEGGRSIERRITGSQTIDTNDNSSDFIELLDPNYQTTNIALVTEDMPPEDNQNNETAEPTPTPEPSPEPTPEPTPTPDPNPEQKTYLPIELSELYIDPASPATDAEDEWVEIYNPNDQAVNLDGYTIYTGTNFSYKYSFPAFVKIEPKSYITVTSGESSLALSNSGGAAKITDPDGQIIDQTTYQSAKTGQSWAKSADGTWAWTSAPTKDNPNIITVAPAVISQAAVKAQKAKASTAKTTAAKTTKSSSKTTKVKAVVDSPDLVKAPTPLPFWLLAPLGTLAVLYACYEYRFEISNKIYQLRQYRANSRANRQKP